MSEAKDECWSADEESYPYSTLGDLLDCNDHLEAGNTVYVGTPERPDPTDFISADDVIEEMATRAYDIGGEWAEDYPDVTEAAKAQLDDLLAAWVREHCPVTFYRVVDVREYTITAEDIAEMSPENEQADDEGTDTRGGGENHSTVERTGPHREGGETNLGETGGSARKRVPVATSACSPESETPHHD